MDEPAAPPPPVRPVRDLADRYLEAAVALEGMLHRLHRTQDASTVSDVILLG